MFTTNPKQLKRINSARKARQNKISKNKKTNNPQKVKYEQTDLSDYED